MSCSGVQRVVVSVLCSACWVSEEALQRWSDEYHPDTSSARDTSTDSAPPPDTGDPPSLQVESGIYEQVDARVTCGTAPGVWHTPEMFRVEDAVTAPTLYACSTFDDCSDTPFVGPMSWADGWTVRTTSGETFQNDDPGPPGFIDCRFYLEIAALYTTGSGRLRLSTKRYSVTSGGTTNSFPEGRCAEAAMEWTPDLSVWTPDSCTVLEGLRE